MPRAKRIPEEAGQAETHKAAAKAAGIVLTQLEQCQIAMQACLETATDAIGHSNELAQYYFAMAVSLGDVSARLAESLARVKGETQHRIRVARNEPADSP